MLQIKTMKEASLIRGHGLVTDQFPQKGNRGRHMKVAIQDWAPAESDPVDVVKMTDRIRAGESKCDSI